MALLPIIDPVNFLPLRYEDLRRPVPVSKITEGEEILVAGFPIDFMVSRTRKGTLLKATIQDENSPGYYYICFFHYTAYQKSLFGQKRRRVYAFGQPKREAKGWTFYHPELPTEVGQILPVYKRIRGISPARVRTYVLDTLKNTEIHDEISEDILAGQGLPKIVDALRELHCPTTSLPREEAYKRVVCRQLAEMVKGRDTIDGQGSLFGEGKEPARNIMGRGPG